eukprot:COSAG03_NODE_891_length_5478_cov_4.529466_1_plen_49_part_00
MSSTAHTTLLTRLAHSLQLARSLWLMAALLAEHTGGDFGVGPIQFGAL